MKWSRLPIREFDAFAADWDRVSATSAAAAPFMRSIFMRPLLRQFSLGNETIIAGYKGGRPVVAAIVQRTRLGMWQTFQPSQLPLGAIVFDRDLDSALVFTDLLKQSPGVALALGVTQLDPIIAPRPAEQACLQTLDYIDTAWVDVAGSFDDYWNARGKNLRHNIRKQRSKLDEQGIALRLEVLKRPQHVAQALVDYGNLESAGWKAGGGTAIHPDNAQGRFYREMLEAYCAEGRARIYRLWFGESVAAIDLCIASDDTLVVLKTTYDEKQQGYSPAFLMRHAAFIDLFAEGVIRRIEFYGRIMDWHKRWTDNGRTLYHVNCYRSTWVPQLISSLARMRKAPPPTTAEQP